VLMYREINHGPDPKGTVAEAVHAAGL